MIRNELATRHDINYGIITVSREEIISSHAWYAWQLLPQISNVFPEIKVSVI